MAATLKFMNTFIANYHRACGTFYIARAETGNTYTQSYTHTHSHRLAHTLCTQPLHLQFSVRFSDLAANVTNKMLRPLCVFFFFLVVCSSYIYFFSFALLLPFIRFGALPRRRPLFSAFANTDTQIDKLDLRSRNYITI